MDLLKEAVSIETKKEEEIAQDIRDSIAKITQEVMKVKDEQKNIVNMRTENKENIDNKDKEDPDKIKERPQKQKNY